MFEMKCWVIGMVDNAFSRNAHTSSREPAGQPAEV
jgi:hypothetical protein